MDPLPALGEWLSQTSIPEFFILIHFLATLTLSSRSLFKKGCVGHSHRAAAAGTLKCGGGAIKLG